MRKKSLAGLSPSGMPSPLTIGRLAKAAGVGVETVRYYQGVQRALGSLGAWEGPAAVVATDGRYLVGALDRMGLRPLRYAITRTGRVILGSELGAVPVPLEDLVETGQLDPGESFAVHLPDRRVLRAHEILKRVVEETPINFAELSETRLLSLPVLNPAWTAGSMRIPANEVTRFSYVDDPVAYNGNHPLFIRAVNIHMHERGNRGRVFVIDHERRPSSARSRHELSGLLDGFRPSHLRGPGHSAAAAGGVDVEAGAGELDGDRTTGPARRARNQRHLSRGATQTSPLSPSASPAPGTDLRPSRCFVLD